MDEQEKKLIATVVAIAKNWMGPMLTLKVFKVSEKSMMRPCYKW